MTRNAEEGRPQLTGLEIALQWSQLPPEHLEIHLKALEPVLAREHELEMENARLTAADAKDARTHKLYMGGLIAGFVLAAGMLAGAVVVGLNDQPWLAAMLSGPSVLSLAALFVLRKVDSGATRQSALAHNRALASSASPPPADPAAAQGTSGQGAV
ncbi:hypothetical protein OG216_19240 [Streptomycetaceae bacterium NBC_01309]